MYVVWQAEGVVEAMSVIVQGNRRLIIWGISCVILGLLAPWMIKVKDFGILPFAEHSIATGSTASLLFASVRLVVLNTLRALPIYIGILLVGEGLGIFDTKRSRWFKIFILFLIPVIYQVIYLIYNIAYDFGVPAMTLVFAIMIVNRNRNMARSVVHKVTVFTLLLFGVEWLDIVPFLTAYGFGRGNVSMYLKDIALLNTADNFLNVTGICLCIIFVGNAFIIARLLNIYMREIKAVEHALEIEHLNNQLQLQSIENRSLREIQSLVHDLKTPLTSIQGLAGVIAISDNQEVVKKHASYISDMVDKMNVMINELLQDDSKQIIAIRELIEYAVAHVPQLNSIAEFHLIIKDNSLVHANKIKLTRAIINILENALEAVEKDTGCIRVVVEKIEGGEVSIVVIDNGQGLMEDQSVLVWEIGFSTKKSSGLGLPFVRNVIEKHGGQIGIGNNVDGGAKVIITLPGV
ncbi:MAG: integral rane sensor signal transduction histidine kinase [Firmicutes bacterium]|nr:integral rane sensor signal transduction histidine kinase [Bacillota bacterium]